MASIDNLHYSNSLYSSTLDTELSSFKDFWIGEIDFSLIENMKALWITSIQLAIPLHSAAVFPPLVECLAVTNTVGDFL